MKTIITLITAIVFSTSCMAGEIKFIDGSLEQAKRDAARLGKPIFIDFYASWCGPCVRMKRDVFTRSEAADFYNSNFVNLRIDVDSQEPDLVKEMDITSIPAMFFINASGEVIYKTTGFIDAPDLVKEGQSVLKYVTAAKGEPGKLKGKDLVEYLTIHKDRHFTEAQELGLRALKDYKTGYDQNAWLLAMTFVDDINHPSVPMFVENANNLFEENHDVATNFWDKVFNKEFQRIVDEKDIPKIKALSALESQLRKNIDELDYDSDYCYQENMILYYRDNGTIDEYTRALTGWVLQYHFSDTKKLEQIATTLIKRGDPTCNKLALELTMRLTSLTDQATALIVHAIALNKNGDGVMGIELISKAKKTGKYSPEEMGYFDETLEYLNR